MKLMKQILPSDSQLTYMGRIDFDNPDAPVFVHPCSCVMLRFRGSSIACNITNIHSFYENSVGVVLDGQQKKFVLNDSDTTELVLGEGLSDDIHELILFKRMDACHHFVLNSFQLPENGELLAAPQLPVRKMEFYGDSVTAGEVSEAVEYCGQPDPQHNGEYSNSWYSYAWCTARRLNAQIHDVAAGGIALLEGTGYFCAPKLYGMEYMYDKIQYNPYIAPPKTWDFSGYRPHVVVVAIGQNDNHPENYMLSGIENEKAMNWRAHYRDFIRTLRTRYPNAEIILSTTILNHDAHWDQAINAVCQELNDPKVHHFLYSNNGCGTHGHIRIPEAEKMADELSSFIESLGEKVWEDAL